LIDPITPVANDRLSPPIGDKTEMRPVKKLSRKRPCQILFFCELGLENFDGSFTKQNYA